MPQQSECVLSSAVEHFLHTEGVAGSNPAARTILLFPTDRVSTRFSSFASGFLIPPNHHMIRSAITVSIVPESEGGPFVYHGDLERGIAAAAATGFNGVEIFPSHADDIDGFLLRGWLQQHSIQ